MYRSPSRKSGLVSAVALVLTLVACSGPKEPTKPKPPPPPKQTVFDGVISKKEYTKQTLDKANEVDRENHEAAMKEIDGPPAEH